MPTTTPLPAVTVAMPDGQTLRGRLHERRQVEDGWLYRIGLILWQAPDPDRPEPGEYTAWMPSTYVQPVPGEDYTAVPTTRLPQEIPPPPAYQGPAPATEWRIESERHPAGTPAEARRTAVHRADCWVIQGQSTVVTDKGEARAAMARPGARGCALCGTDQDLKARGR
ncbi:DUF6233 domain-containing protein [Streptomyces microflavus]